MDKDYQVKTQEAQRVLAVNSRIQITLCQRTNSQMVCIKVQVGMQGLEVYQKMFQSLKWLKGQLMKQVSYITYQ